MQIYIAQLKYFFKRGMMSKPNIQAIEKGKTQVIHTNEKLSLLEKKD